MLALKSRSLNFERVQDAHNLNRKVEGYMGSLLQGKNHTHDWNIDASSQCRLEPTTQVIEESHGGLIDRPLRLDIQLMTSHIKKENHLQGCFDQGYFNPLVTKNPYCAGQVIFDSSCVGGDGVPTTPEKETMALQASLESPVVNAPAAIGMSNAPRFNNPQYNMMQCDGKAATTNASANKKRKRQSADSPTEETDDFKSQLYSMLETSSRVLTAHVESQNANSQLDRNQRKEHMESLVGVLGKLADAVGKIAERL